MPASVVPTLLRIAALLVVARAMLLVIMVAGAREAASDLLVPVARNRPATRRSAGVWFAAAKGMGSKAHTKSPRGALFCVVDTGTRGASRINSQGLRRLADTVDIDDRLAKGLRGSCGMLWRRSPMMSR